MKFYNIIFILFSCIRVYFAEQVEVVCPSHCQCDIFATLRRATCTHRNLASVQAFIPNITQILDMSFNQITEFQDHVFYDESLTSLKLLNVSHNLLSQIHINAFYGLDKMKSLDLSFNSLQYILPHWFWSLNHLEELYLTGNSFQVLSEEPLFESKSLRVLDLRNCRISSLGADVFIKIPNLEHLDLSENDMIQLPLETITPMKSLHFLNLTGNVLECNENAENITRYCSQKGIEFTNPCKKGVNKMYEKIIMSTTVSTMERNSWIYDKQEETFNNNKNTTIVNDCGSRIQNKTILVEILELSPELSLLTTLVTGILIGLIIGCSVQIHYSYSPKNTFPPRNGPRFARNSSSSIRSRMKAYFESTANLKSRRNEEDEQNLVLTALSFAESSPLFTRKFDK